MRIEPVEMWATPTSQEDLTKRVTELDGPGAATHAMMFTWNYLASVVNKDDKDDRPQENVPSP